MQIPNREPLLGRGGSTGFRWMNRSREGSACVAVDGSIARMSTPASMKYERNRFVAVKEHHRSQYANGIYPFQDRRLFRCQYLHRS
jgi:hypothetical protein